MVLRLISLLMVLVAFAWSGCAQLSAQVTTFAFPSETSGPAQLVAGPDALWVVETFQGKLYCFRRPTLVEVSVIVPTPSVSLSSAAC